MRSKVSTASSNNLNSFASDPIFPKCPTPTRSYASSSFDRLNTNHPSCIRVGRDSSRTATRLTLRHQNDSSDHPSLQAQSSPRHGLSQPSKRHLYSPFCTTGLVSNSSSWKYSKTNPPCVRTKAWLARSEV